MRIYIYVCIYIHIYIYLEREKQKPNTYLNSIACQSLEFPIEFGIQPEIPSLVNRLTFRLKLGFNRKFNRLSSAWLSD